MIKHVRGCVFLLQVQIPVAGAQFLWVDLALVRRLVTLSLAHRDGLLGAGVAERNHLSTHNRLEHVLRKVGALAGLVQLCHSLEDLLLHLSNVQIGGNVVLLPRVVEQGGADRQLGVIQELAEGGLRAIFASVASVAVALSLAARASVHAVARAVGSNVAAVWAIVPLITQTLSFDTYSTLCAVIRTGLELGAVSRRPPRVALTCPVDALAVMVTVPRALGFLIETVIARVPFITLAHAIHAGSMV
jgi:hypothetical protein